MNPLRAIAWLLEVLGLGLLEELLDLVAAVPGKVARSVRLLLSPT